MQFFIEYRVHYEQQTANKRPKLIRCLFLSVIHFLSLVTAELAENQTFKAVFLLKLVFFIRLNSKGYIPGIQLVHKQLACSAFLFAVIL